MLKVLHLDSELTWRGGENQIRLLAEGAPGALHYIGAPSNSAIFKKNLPCFSGGIPIGDGWLGRLSAFRRILQFVDTEGISIIDVHAAKAHRLALYLKRCRPHLKVVVHRRVDNPLSHYSRRKYLSPMVDQYVAISSRISQMLVEYGVRPELVTTIHSGTSDPSFDINSKPKAKASLCKRYNLGVFSQSPLIVNIGYMTKQKGQDTLLMALKIMKDQGIDFGCLLVGDGPLRSSLEQLTDKLALRDQVRFLGVVSDVGELLAGADLMAMPSNNEGLGTSLIDAAFYGVALVASNVGGIPEIIEDGTHGRLIPAGDAVALAAAIADLLSHPNEMKAMVRQALSHVVSKFSASQMAQRNFDLYLRLAAQSDPVS